MIFETCLQKPPCLDTDIDLLGVCFVNAKNVHKVNTSGGSGNCDGASTSRVPEGSEELTTWVSAQRSRKKCWNHLLGS